MPGTGLRVTLNVLAVAAPAWLRERSDAKWGKRYDRRLDDARLPEDKEARQRWAETVGPDRCTLLTAIDDSAAHGWLREVPAVQVVRLVWLQQYSVGDGMLHWRTDEQGIPSEQLQSPAASLAVLRAAHRGGGSLATAVLYSVRARRTVQSSQRG